MSRIFLSHSSADEVEAVALQKWLADNGWDDVFLDIDAERGLVAGERWQEALRRAADRCEAVVFIVSSAWAKSKWCLAEFLLAKSLHKLIFGVVLKDISTGELPTEMTSEWQLCQLIGEGATEAIHFTHRGDPKRVYFLADGLKRLKFGLKNAGLSADFFPWPPAAEPERSPYRGLEGQNVQDAAIFFGRDAEILQGLDSLRGMRANGTDALFVILAASGAGKSSFLRAGLLPRLARDDRHFYPLDVVRPENSPLFGERGLAQSLSKAHANLKLSPGNFGEIKAALIEGPERFRVLLQNIQDAVRERLIGLPDGAPPPTLVLPVDQAEELLSTDATAEARTFLDLIGATIRGASVGRRHVPLIVAFTIRSDRYEPLQTAPELAGLKTVVFDALKPMHPVQFKEVITGPARRATATGNRLNVKPDLVSRLLADCAVGADTLPLLSLTLARLYRDYGSDGDLRLDEYLRMGGMADIIQSEAESILARDPKKRQEQLELLHAAFVPWLATINQDNDEPMRRVERISNLPEESRPLIQALIEKRLLLGDVRNGEQVVEVAHESLLRQWSELARWLTEERENLKHADRLELDTAAWERSGRRADWLLEGERLATAEALAAEPAYWRRLEPVREFLLASHCRQVQRREEEARHRQAELVAAQEKQAAAQALAGARQRQVEDAERVTRRTRVFSAVIAVFGLLALGLSFKVFQERQRAGAAAQTALARQLAAQAIDVSTRNLDLSLLLALQAAKVEASSETLSALGHAIAVSGAVQRILTGPQGWVNAVAASADGRWFASADDQMDVLVWEAASGKVQWRLAQPTIATALTFAPDSAWLASADKDGQVRRWDMASGQRLPGCASSDPERAFVVDLSTEPESAGQGARQRDWRVTEVVPSSAQPGVSPATPRAAGAVSALATPDAGRWFASSGPQACAAVTATGKSVTALAASGDGKRYAIAAADGTVAVWDAGSGQALWRQQRHQGAVYGLAFSHDAQWLASGGEDREIQLWKVADGWPIARLSGHIEAIKSLAFGAGDRQLVSGGPDSRVIVWALDATRWPGTFNGAGALDRAALSGDGRWLAAAGKDGDTYLWQLPATAAPLVFKDHQDAVLGLAFDTSGRWLASASRDKTVVLRAVDAAASTPEPTRVLKHHRDEVWGVAFSPDGSRLASGGSDNAVVVWDKATGDWNPKDTLAARKRWVYGLAYDRQGRWLASSGGDHDVVISDTQTGRAVKTLTGHAKNTNGIAFSHNGDWLAVASDDQRVSLWRTADWSRADFLEGHAAEVWGVAFSPDGQTLVSGARDGTLIAWNVASRKQVFQLHSNIDRINSVAWLPNGLQVVTAGGANHARLWDMDAAGWPARACVIANRNLTQAEWDHYVGAQLYALTCPNLPPPPDLRR